MPYYRHYIEHDGHSGKSTIGFVFSELDADELIKSLDSDRMEYCKGYSSKEREMRYHKPLFSHEITKEDFDAKKIYTIPIKQIIYSPVHVFY